MTVIIQKLEGEKMEVCGYKVLILHEVVHYLKVDSDKLNIKATTKIEQ